MKKILTLGMVLALAASIMFTSLSLTGCDNGGGTTTTPDTTPPTVVSVTPANNSTGVATTGDVVITFNEAMNTTSGTVTLDGAVCSGTWSENNTKYTVPYENLAPANRVTITISGFKDKAGNTMTEDVSRAFTTVGYIDPNAKAGLYDTESIGADDEPRVAIDKTSATTVTATFKDAIDYVNIPANGRKSYTLVLNGDVSIPAGNVIGNSDSNVSLRIIGLGANRTISLSSPGFLFTVKPRNTLVLDNNITLKGLTNNSDSLVKVDPRGALKMNNGSAIKDNTINDAQGGGVFLEGIFTMYGGEISGNKITCTPGYEPAYGGGVFLLATGIFYMYDGKITDNTCDVIPDGDISQSRGGGVSMLGGNFYMSGGKITGNKAFAGGGVLVGDGTFTMSGGEISGNDAFFGGGVVVGSGIVTSAVLEATFIMDSGKISGNTSEVMGGGVYLGGEHVTFTMEGGEISGNTALTDSGGGGGGVYMEGYLFTMKGGTISKNIASNGGGVVVERGGFRMYGNGEISSNTASKGGGVYLAAFASVSVDVYFRMTDGTIYGSNAPAGQRNIATTHNSGAAIYIDPGFDAKYGTVNSSGGFIQKGFFTETNYESTVKVVDGELVP